MDALLCLVMLETREVEEAAGHDWLATVVRYNGMVARKLPLGPSRLPCIYMVFAPLLNFIICTQYTLYTHHCNASAIAFIYTNIPLPIKLIP
jgi:hypothetical protein